MDGIKKVAIIGGGISGLTTAYWLKQKGFDVKLFEKNDRVGGTIRTDISGGFLIEYGPNSTLETTPLIDELLGQLGILDEKILASKESNKRYILKNGKLYPLPMSPIPFLSTGLFSFSAKLRLMKEPFIKSKGNELETIAEFTKRRLGQEFLDYAINPFVAGVFAGNPELINVKTAFPKLFELEQTHGSLIKGAVKSARARKKSKEKSKQSAKTISFKKGMQTLTDALKESLKEEIILNSSVGKIDTGGENNVYKLTINKNGKLSSGLFDSVIISTPSYITGDIISGIDKNLSGKLKDVYYPPVNVIYLAFKKSYVNFKLDGFGYLIPQKENRKILGSLWSSCLFPGRSPDDYYALTSFIGGARSPELTKMDDKELIDTTILELDSVLGLRAEPEFKKVMRWGKAIPQYNLNYPDIFNSVEDFQNKNKGLFICSNFYKGISVCDCIKNADATVNNVINYLEKNSI